MEKTNNSMEKTTFLRTTLKFKPRGKHPTSSFQFETTKQAKAILAPSCSDFIKAEPQQHPFLPLEFEPTLTDRELRACRICTEAGRFEFVLGCRNCTIRGACVHRGLVGGSCHLGYARMCHPSHCLMKVESNPRAFVRRMCGGRHLLASWKDICKPTLGELMREGVDGYPLYGDDVDQIMEEVVEYKIPWW